MLSTLARSPAIPVPPTLSLIIPTYNQRERTRRAAAEAAAGLRDLGEPFELVVVDDGSRPGRGVAADDLPPGTVFVGLPRNLGKGGAVRAGVERARGEFVVFTDSDLPFALVPLPTTLAWLREGADLVVGDRLLPQSAAPVSAGPLRRLASAVFTWMVQRLCRLDLDDTQCGYKGYRGAAARELFAELETLSFAFDVEVLLRARGKGLVLRRQPVRLVNEEDSSVRLWRHAPGMTLDVLRIAWRRARGAYG